MKGEKLLLATPLLKWYLEHGLVVTRVHEVVEFTPGPCCKPFGDAVSDTRRAGDTDPRKAIIAFTMKLVSFLFHFFWVIGGGEVYFFCIQIRFIKSTFFFILYLGGQFRLRKNITNHLKHRNGNIVDSLRGAAFSWRES